VQVFIRVNFGNIHTKVLLSFPVVIAAPDNQSSSSDRTDEYPISLSATWAQDEGVVALLTQSPYFSGDKVSLSMIKLLCQLLGSQYAYCTGGG
jgi:hypothetical protein